MAVITHTFVSAVEDNDDTSLVQPSHWNDEHVIEGLEDDLNANFTSNFTTSFPTAFSAAFIAAMAAAAKAETPSGTIDSTDGINGNDTFTLSANPDNGFLLLVKNQGVMIPGIHYALSTNTIVYTTGNNPKTGDVHYAWYFAF